MQKTCTQCGKERPLEAFRFNERTGRYSYVCVDCKTPQFKKDYLYKSIENFLRKKVGATKRRPYETDLTLEDVMAIYREQGGRCAITGETLTHHEDTPLTNASIDRIDNSVGYTKDNVQLVCSVVNIMRNRLTNGELIEWAAKISKAAAHAD